MGYSNLNVNNSISTKQLNGYLYLNINPAKWFSTTLGVSIDSYEDSSIKRNQVNPKVGVFIMPNSDLVFRAAFFRSLKRSFVTNQTIEKTQISGFNQFYDDRNGTSSWNYGIGIDYQISKKIFTGGEISWRRLKHPIVDDFQKTVISEKRDEVNGLAYLYWVPSDFMTARIEYKLEKFERNFIQGRADSFKPEGITNHLIPFNINFFHSAGALFKFGGSYVNQQVNFVTESRSIPETGELFKEKTGFWVFNTSIGYRLPKRLGLVSFDVKNIFNNHFRFQSSFDAFAKTPPTYFPERQFFLNFRITY